MTETTKTYRIYQPVTGIELWRGSAVDEADAQERHARAAGYDSYAGMIAALPDDDDTTEVEAVADDDPDRGDD